MFWLLPSFIVSSVLFILSALVYIVKDVDGIRIFFKDETVNILRSMKGYSKREAQLLESFSQYSVVSLRYAATRLTDLGDSVNSAVGLLVGAISKIGFIPGIVAIILSMSKLSDSDVYIYDVLALTVCALYFVCFKIAPAEIFLKRYALLINFHLEHMREK